MGGRLQPLLQWTPSSVLLNMSLSFTSEVESAQNKRQLCGGSQAAIERMIHFGRELQSMSEHLRRECGKNSANKKMLKVKQNWAIPAPPPPC